MLDLTGLDFTSSEWRPDDPPYGLDPVVHVCLGIRHEQEGLMADWRAVLVPRSTCRGAHEGTKERDGVEVSTAVTANHDVIITYEL